MLIDEYGYIKAIDTGESLHISEIAYITIAIEGQYGEISDGNYTNLRVYSDTPHERYELINLAERLIG